MKIGVVFPQTEIGQDPAAIRDYAQAVESMGYTCEQRGRRVPQDDVCAFQKQHREPWQLVPWLEGTVTGDSLTGQTGTANNAPKVVSARAK